LFYGSVEWRVRFSTKRDRQSTASRLSCAYKFRGRTIKYAKGCKDTQKRCVSY
jgi:hypothetical protein